MNPLQKAIPQGCYEGQGFALNYNPSYTAGGLIGHTGIDIHCGYGTQINALASGDVYSVYPIDHPASDGYTAIFTLIHTPLEDFEFTYGHVAEIDCKIGDHINMGDIIAKEGNHGTVYAGNVRITLAMQAAGNHEGSHRHYQKRPVIKTKQLMGLGLQTASSTYRDKDGYYYQIYAYNNGFNGCVDWTRQLFPRDLMLGMTGYDVFLLQRAMVKEGFASYNPTGTFGPLTLQSVRNYQKTNNVSATGYCGPVTRLHLNQKYFQLS